MANDNFYSLPKLPRPAWSSFDSEEMYGGSDMEFKSDGDGGGSGERLQTEGGGGDIGGDNQFMMTINGTQATQIGPEGQPIPSPVFSFRVLEGSVKFEGDEFEGTLSSPVGAYGPENVEFPTGSRTELWFCYCKVTFSRNPDTQVADRKITAIDNTQIVFGRAASVTEALDMWSGSFENPIYIFKIGYLSVTQDGPTRRFVYAMVIHVGPFNYNSEVLPLELQVIVEESGTNVVKTLKLKGNISSAS